ncbi:hypothetical protein UVI_02040690 [Ustilaginoidea virens]|nr:hypothetical protein UVI_02040690 [Ustilaginoidea virens]
MDQALRFNEHDMRPAPSPAPPPRPPPSPPPLLPCRAATVRDASSEYPSPEHNTSRIQSPVSEYQHGHRLSLSSLSRFGRANDCLSNLRSSSPASSKGEAVGDTSHHDLIADTAAAITEWQDAGRPLKKMSYHNYSLANSSEVFPSDSLSQREDFSLAPSSPPSTPPDQAAASPSDADAVGALGDQYDGTMEARHDASPKVRHPISPALNNGPHSFCRSKRKASAFSLRSLTRPLTKRRRLAAFCQWASKVSRRLTETYRRFKNQHQVRKERDRDAWGANRRSEELRNPPISWSKGSNGVFEFHGGRQRNEDWWKEGVGRYRAPSGMFATVNDTAGR